MDINRHSTLDQVAAAIEKAKTESAHPAEYFNFRIELAKSAALAWKEASPLASASGLPDDLALKLAAGNVVLKPEKLEIGEEWAAGRAADTTGIFARHGMAFGEALSAFVADKGGAPVAGWIRMLLKRDRKGLAKEARTFDMQGSMLAFFAAEVARPVMVRTAEALRPALDEERWKRGNCLVCGSDPCFSKYEGEGGARYLLCMACGTIWKFQRIHCPFCGCTDGKKHGFMSYDDDPSYRIDHCGECKRYMKALDLRGKLAQERVLEAEDAMTLYLDLAAEKKGFKR